MLLRRRESLDTQALPAEWPELIKQVYVRRGVKTAADVERRAQALLPFQGLQGMDDAVNLLISNLQQRKKILIVGDFDADGATSTALLMAGLPQFGFRAVDFLVPNRFEYGYGLSPEIVELAAAKGAELIITVDNGISSINGVDKAQSLGIPVLITDHHLPGEQLPKAAAIVNPNLSACAFPSKNLAGVGVAFYLLMALRSKMREQDLFAQQGLVEPNIASLLDLVALGTVADVVPLDSNNRILVHQGLQRIRAGACRPGIQALIEVSGRNKANMVASDLGFSIGPRLNAVGRLDDMSLGIHCLLSDDIHHACQLASEMDSLNSERKDIEASMQQEAQQSVSKLSLDSQSLPKALCLYQADWHQGVVGLVASRIKEKYYRPVFAFADGDNGEVKGSGRSVAGVHLRDLLERIDTQNPGLISKFGGHAMAAGLSLSQARFAEFQLCLEKTAKDFIDEECLTHTLLSDGELAPEQLVLGFAESLREAGPWGQGFPEPLFDGEFELCAQRVVGEKHLKMSVKLPGMTQEIDAIAFNVDRSIWPNASLKQVQLVYKLDVNEFRGRRSVQLMVEHLAPL
ncbi:single-stranded-DNA-specific exonuclease RecJ [Agarivorans aestuarii]|uniref:Single-stranded-DNA-specific exonuclease RecJ n=1 Tax=Agarivorans aestuarii TaxID=1563703 RepID=A0ABU7G337_9ALTE|nr:single-stranded-DNA-specific exonuclease RecJ [Agarivorans aestuarii]MEE1673414.1 single-stranded-DNA-specific exonuclease RecJ [Agarivorans aestuarii]